jgi:hypothetical protein
MPLLLGYGWTSQIANDGFTRHDVLNAILSSAFVTWLPREEAGDSLPGAQLAIKNHA